MSAERRSALRRIGVVVGVGALGAPVVASALRPAELGFAPFSSIEAALTTLRGLRSSAPRFTGAWDLPHVLNHAAQVIEYSMEGFPQLRPAWFRATVGSYAFALFNSRARMTHSLVEPIAGAPDIVQGMPLLPAVDRVVDALEAFADHHHALSPHFAFGALDKTHYTRVHLMHLADHWTEAAAA